MPILRACSSTDVVAWLPNLLTIINSLQCTPPPDVKWHTVLIVDEGYNYEYP
jgi:hypothetical protein